jgi:DNA-directed RNA polymerase specialized sigma subunit
VDVELARHQWEDGNRRVESARGDRRRFQQLHAEIDRVTNELRKRVGQSFTLAELADEYARADDWVRDVLDEADPEAPPVREAGVVVDAAFHRYARGAVDYQP